MQRIGMTISSLHHFSISHSPSIQYNHKRRLNSFAVQCSAFALGMGHMTTRHTFAHKRNRAKKRAMKAGKKFSLKRPEWRFSAGVSPIRQLHFFLHSSFVIYFFLIVFSLELSGQSLTMVRRGTSQTSHCPLHLIILHSD